MKCPKCQCSSTKRAIEVDLGRDRWFCQGCGNYWEMDRKIAS